MATLSTSAVSPVGGIAGAQSGRLGELAIALFLLPAVSHRGFSFEARRRAGPRLSDPQIQLMLITVLGVTAVLFLRSFVGAAEIDRQDNLLAAMRAVWGSVFTVLSFLTTTGFVSEDWQRHAALVRPARARHHPPRRRGDGRRHRHHRRRDQAPAPLRALPPRAARDGQARPPESVGRRGQGDALISRGGARIAFIFLMLTLIALALVMLALAATGLSFQREPRPRRRRADHHRAGHPHPRGRPRLRRPLRRRPGDLLRRDDRRAHRGRW